MPTISLATTLQSMENILSSNVQNSLKSSTAFHSESKVPLKSDYAKIVSSSTQPALVLNDTFERHVHLSAKAVKAPSWFSVPHAIGIHRNANSVIPTSADTGLLLLNPSASHPHVIDNLTELLNDSNDLRPREKSITNLGEIWICLAEPTKYSMKGNDMTDLCLTCLTDRKAMSSEKFAASPTASPHIYLGSPSLTSLNSFHPSSTGESKEAKESNNFKNAINYNHPSLPFTHNKTERKTVSLLSHIAAELSSEKHKFTTLPPSRTYPSETLVTASPKLTSTAQYPSSKPSYTREKPVKHGHQKKFNKNVSISQIQCLSLKGRKSLKDQDITGPVSNASFIAPLSSFNNPLRKGRAHGTASHPTRMNSIEAPAEITPFALCRPTVSTVTNPKSCFLTGKDGTFISVSNRQAKPKPTSQTKQSILTLLQKDLTIRLATVTHKQSPANLQTTVSTTAMTRVQTSTFATRKVSLKVFDFDVSQSALTGLKSKKQKEALSKVTERRDSEGNRPDSKLIDLHNIHNLTLGDEQGSLLSVVTENKDNDTLQSNSNNSRDITKMFLKDDEILENKREELLRLDDPEI
ncbi:hypothetical protein CCH79_00003822 [Gambusia affinis]|uniref:Uncharacterized protein n=1 Tax=Gambusia affinis TaxID=33528 RepID=A0A315VA67_GAMAF|nr:hypothetical protein CCH79_00003822 [Gambusia affinis]